MLDRYAKTRTGSVAHLTDGGADDVCCRMDPLSHAVTLNKTGRKLLAKYKRLPAKLTIMLTLPNGKPLVIKTSHLTLKPPKKHTNKHKKH